MRTSVLGTMKFNDMKQVIENTRSACMVTHADPRCIASCVAVTTAIALMLQQKHVLNNGEQDVDAIMNMAHSYAEQEIELPEHVSNEPKHRCKNT
jgi:ADP-ribosylglycohydrolase